MDEFKSSSELSFDRMNILKIRGRVIEADDTIPVNLPVIITQHVVEIQAAFRRIAEYEARHMPFSPDKITPSILLSRLATLSSLEHVLSRSAIEANEQIYPNDSALESSYLAYWTEVENTGFTPQLQRVIEPIGYAGIWLAIQPKRPKHS